MTHEYVQMVMTAFPLQRKWLPGNGDLCIRHKFYKKLYAYLLRENMCTVGYKYPQEGRNLGGWKGYKWVPRIDQLLWWWNNRVCGGLYTIRKTGNNSYEFMTEFTKIIESGKCLEEAILKAIMRVEYNRHWENGKWRKQILLPEINAKVMAT